MNEERQRLLNNDWRKWGSYVSDRQWGTVREDYSANGDAWRYTTHDMARSRAWRWGEEGIGGICDNRQLLCFGWAFWNGRDPLLKERFFGLTNYEGNHGEDVKELYYYLDATPSHSYMKMLYKYPQQEFPYRPLVEENGRRSRVEEEYELIDTGIFDDNRYFDIFIEYAKAGVDDVLIRITIHNRAANDAGIHLLPTLWFRNTWSWGRHDYTPVMRASDDNSIIIQHEQLAVQRLYLEKAAPLLFCDNNTNTERLFNEQGENRFFKDGINDHIIDGKPSINPSQTGTKAAAKYEITVPAGGSVSYNMRLCHSISDDPFAGIDDIFKARIAEANEFYGELQHQVRNDEEKMIQRQALAGMLWNKQFYSFKVQQWLEGDPAMPPPPASRNDGRDADWKQLNNEDIISMPDKWEFPWYAAWDWAFHCVVLAMIDPDFAKQQLQLLAQEWYMHPSGKLPAYEWQFNDANPPVHAGAVFRVFKQDAHISGKKDYVFLESMFHKLLINFTWWVNRKDREGNNIFEGGFLGLDNIGLFDRSMPLAGGIHIEQADATSWMAMYALNMMHIALELAGHDAVYTSMATKFFEHFLYIAGAMDSMGKDGEGLWDDEDEFFYDQLRMPDKRLVKVKVKSLVGLIPLFAVEVLTRADLEANPVFAERMSWFLRHRPDLAALVSRWYEGKDEKYLLSLLRGHRMKRLLHSMLNATEFLSDYGVRSLSKIYEQPYTIGTNGTELSIRYVPGESDSGMYGGNSNWRGPVWMPANFIIIESLRKFHFYYSDDFKIEYPTGSGQYATLKQVGNELAERLLKIFLKNEDGYRPLYGNRKKLQEDPHFNNYILFHEYFHGDNGKGLGASHQTGWTGLIANLITMLGQEAH